MDQFIFFPESLNKDFKYNLGDHDQEVFYKTVDGETINGILFRANEDESNPVFLYFHGNAGSLSSWQYIWDDLRDLGYDLFIIDYRSYGKSSGAISEEGIYNDARGAYSHLISLGYESSHIILFGRSLGSAPAIQLATEKNVKAVVLESPFENLLKLAQAIFPIQIESIPLDYSFDNIGKLDQIKVPIHVMHGDADEIVPYEQGLNIFKAISSIKTMITIKGGGHNNLSAFPDYMPGLQTFLNSL